jgi:hypothetical protein
MPFRRVPPRKAYGRRLLCAASEAGIFPAEEGEQRAKTERNA